MGTYNSLSIAAFNCPRCGILMRDLVLECKFGNTSQMADLAIGDEYPWVPRKAIQNGGRPDGGDIDGAGYGDCPHCGKDFFLKIVIRRDRIVGVDVDSSQRGYVPD
jgi:hypothetical protein